MADPIGAVNNATNKVDISKWQKLTAQEILREESKGEEIPAEIVAWAEQMAAFSKIPDNVTYEQVDGEVGLDALDKLGLEDPAAPTNENAVPPEETETEEAVTDVEQTGEVEEFSDEENIFANPTPGNAAEEPVTGTEDEEIAPEDELSLSDEALTTDPEEIRKRKERKGLA